MREIGLNTERKAAVLQWDEHLGPGQRSTHVRRRVLLTGLDVLPAPVLAHDALHRSLEVTRDGRVGVLVDRHARGRVRHEDERGRGTFDSVQRRLDLAGDLDELRLALRADLDLAHVVILRRR